MLFLTKPLGGCCATTTGGHAGVAKTLARLSENFHWDGIWDDVARFVA